MTQGNNPFQNIPSGLIPQPILSSNVRASTSSQPQQQQPQPQQQRRQQLSQQSPTPRSFAPIAPDPIGLQRMQAVRQNQEVEENQHSKKRRLTQPSMEAPQPAPLKDDDKLLLQLKDEQQLPWKNIVSRFQQETGKVHAIAALQMRYKRLKDRLQVWTDPDIEALTQAHDYWESRKFDIISAKVCFYLISCSQTTASRSLSTTFATMRTITLSLRQHGLPRCEIDLTFRLHRCSSLERRRSSQRLRVDANGKSYIQRQSTHFIKSQQWQVQALLRFRRHLLRNPHRIPLLTPHCHLLTNYHIPMGAYIAHCHHSPRLRRKVLCIPMDLILHTANLDIASLGTAHTCQ